MQLNISEEHLKHLMKEAMLEAFEEKQEVFQDFILEVIEEIGLVEAIKEGRTSAFVSSIEIMQILQENPLTMSSSHSGIL